METLFTIEIHNLSEEMLDDFDKLVVQPSYPGGRSEAIRDLIRKELKRRKRYDWGKACSTKKGAP